MKYTKSSALLFVILLSMLLMSCSWTPLHDIRPREDYIAAGVQIGDIVEIETVSAGKFKFEVTEVSASAVIGAEHNVEFSDIAKIGTRSWTEPPHPCGGSKPVGCSVPEVVLVLSQDYADHAKKFHGACVTHDFCYRHGFATYGLERHECDGDFYEDMKKECGGPGMLDALDVTNFGICQIAAMQTYEAVRRYGEAAFQTTTSKYCDYR